MLKVGDQEPSAFGVESWNPKVLCNTSTLGKENLVMTKVVYKTLIQNQNNKLCKEIPLSCSL